MARRFGWRSGDVHCRQLDFSGAQNLHIHSVSDTDYTVDKNDYLIHYTRSDTGTGTITLPSALLVAGNTVIVNDAGNNCNTNNITIATEGTDEYIDGTDADTTMSTNSQTVALYTDGSHWYTY